jgi:hypothetical protein
MFKFIHHLLNPHCQECKDEQEDDKVCKSCETLKHQLEIANYEKERLLKALLENDKPADNQSSPPVNYEPIRSPKSVTWAIRKQMLEAEDKEKAKLMSMQNNKVSGIPESKEIEQLEKELGLVGG